MKRIYLACPYSHPDPRIRQYRYEVVTRFAAELIQKGFIVYSPITHSHPIALIADLPTGWDYWQVVDESFLEWCHEMHIVCLPGWKESTGLKAETELALSLGKPVVLLEEPLDGTTRT